MNTDAFGQSFGQAGHICVSACGFRLEPARRFADLLRMGKHIILAGGSGFVGRSLAACLRARDAAVTLLTRTPADRPGGIREIAWDGTTVGDWAKALDGADAVVNLAGHSINCVHTPANRRLILESRLNAVRALSAAIRRAAQPPAVLVQASAIGFYGNTGDTPCDESSPAGTGFTADTCREWETALDINSLPATRCVVLRLGVVLGRDGGALPQLARLARLFLGGAAGDGRQFITWIHQADLNAVILATLENEGWRGTFNAVAPTPVTNAEFMRELRRVLRRPWSPPAPALAIRLLAPLLGTDPSLALDGQRVLPRRLLAAGFPFRHPRLPSALQELLAPTD
jgi:uncharacterized protein